MADSRGTQSAQSTSTWRLRVMNARSMLALPVLSAGLILGAGCAHEAAAPTHTAMKLRTETPSLQRTTTSTARNINTSNMGISPELAQACKIDFNNVKRTVPFRRACSRDFHLCPTRLVVCANRGRRELCEDRCRGTRRARILRSACAACEGSSSVLF